MTRQDYILAHFELHKKIYGYYPHYIDYGSLSTEEIRDQIRDMEEEEVTA